MNLDAAMREALIAALQSPEGRAAIRAAVVDAIPEPAPAPIPLHSPEEEISLKEASRLSGYSVDTLRRWIENGKLAAHKGAKEWRVKRGDLTAACGKPGTALSALDIQEEARKIRAGGRGRP
jgi:excisionase family DNA binding protein